MTVEQRIEFMCRHTPGMTPEKALADIEAARTANAARTKVCRGPCVRELTYGQFHKSGRTSDKLQAWCKDCSKTASREWNRDNPERYKHLHLMSKYGLSLAKRDEMFAAQGYKCAMPHCQAVTPGGKGDWHTDHCHGTGRVRGILCHNCNVRLGIYEKFIRQHIGAVEAYLTSKPLN